VIEEGGSLPRRALRSLRQEGLGGFWWRTLGVTFYRRLVVVAREVAGPPGSRAKLALSFEYLGQESLDDYMRLRPDADRFEIQRRLLTGQRCALARHNGEVVSARWVATERAEVPYLDLVFALPEGVAYVYDVYTTPSARGRGISGEARIQYEELLRAAGTRTLIGTFMPENTAGLGLVRGAGYERVGMIGCLRLPGLRLPIRRLPAGYLGDANRMKPAAGGSR